MNEILKNFLKSIPLVRNTLNDYQLSHNKNGIASYRITKRKIQRFIDLLNSDYPQVHVNFLDVGAYDGLASTCGMPVNAIFGYLKLLKNRTIHGIEPEQEAIDRLLKSKEYDKIYPYAAGPTNGECKFYITNWIGCSSLSEPNPDYIAQYSPLWASWWTTKRTCTTKTKTLKDIIGSTPYDFTRMTFLGPNLEILEGMDLSFFHNLTCIQLLTHAIPFYKNQHTLGDILNFFKEQNFVPIAMVPYTWFADLEIHHNVTFVKSPTEIKTLDQLLKHCLIGMMLQKPYYVSYLLNKFRSLFPNEQAYRKLWRYV